MYEYLPIELARSVRRAERRKTARQQWAIDWMPAIFGVSMELFESLFNQLDQKDKDRLTHDVFVCVDLYHTGKQPPSKDFLRNIIGGVDLMLDWKRRFCVLAIYQALFQFKHLL